MSHLTTMTLKTPLGRTSAFARGLAMAALAAGAWALSAGMSTAHAKDVYFSVGVNSPGVSVGVSNLPPPRVVHRRPVYVEQAPVIVHPGYHSGYRPRPVYNNNYGYVRPVVVVPQPVYVQGGWAYRGDRYDRYDRRGDRRHYRNDRYHSGHNQHKRHRHDR